MKFNNKLDSLLMSGASSSKKEKNPKLETIVHDDGSLEKEIDSWAEKIQGSVTPLSEYEAINIYASSGKSPRPYVSLAKWIDAILSIHKGERLPDEYRAEDDLQYLEVLKDPVLQTATERFQQQAPQSVKDISKAE